jgi:hypothetical protein
MLAMIRQGFILEEAMRLFGQTGAQRGWEVDCNTYRSEITNERPTLDECRLDALNFPSAAESGWGREKFSPEKKLY